MDMSEFEETAQGRCVTMIEDHKIVEEVVDSEHTDNEPCQTANQGQRKTNRLHKRTDKMMEYMDQETKKREQRIQLYFEHWKIKVRECKKLMKTESSEECLGIMIDDIRKLEEDVIEAFEHFRSASSVPNQSLVRKVDSCVAISKDMISLINEKIAGFDDGIDYFNVLRRNKYAKSVFSDLTLSSVSESESVKSQLSILFMDAVADLATKRVELESIRKEGVEQLKLEDQQRKIREMQNEKSVSIAEARLKAYSDLIQGELNIATTISSHPTSAVPIVTPACSHSYIMPITSQPTSVPAISTSHPQRLPDNVINLSNTTNDDSTTANLARVFANSVNISRLPIPEPSVFTGDPLRFVEWKTAFHALIEWKGIPEQEILFYLKRYVAGEALQAINGVFYSGSNSAYESARKVLQDRYGHPFVMQKAFRKRPEDWPKVPEENSKALRDLNDFLLACGDATPQVPSLKILDDCSENQSKLPNWAALHWNRQVQECIDSTGEYPPFSMFVDFVVKEARIACNPVSSLSALKDTDKKPTREHRNSSQRVNNFATSTYRHNETRIDIRPQLCEYCEKVGHSLIKCEKFVALTISDKRDVIRKKNLCFGCLHKGHRNKDCTRKHTCVICKGRPLTCLHENVSPVQRQPEIKEANSLHINREYSNSTSMIVPVWISAEHDPSHEILTYALLDTQSDTSFILEETTTALLTDKQPIRLSLSTMTSQHTIIESSRIRNFRVRGFKYTDAVAIDCIYTRDFIPVDSAHIPERKTVDYWPHLQEIKDELMPIQSCEVGLLIGYNCPTRIIKGENNQPYAVQTILGWSVVGYSPYHSESNVKVISCRTCCTALHPRML